jgi:uncharacterized membrane protein YfcA
MLGAPQFAVLFGTGLAAGFVDSIAGGGGLITLPVMLNFCPDPVLALGTNKLQASFGSTSAAVHFARAGTLNFPEVRRACLLAFLGSLLGTLLIQQFNPDLLKHLVPVLLLGVAILVWLRPQLGELDVHPRLSRFQFDFIFAFGLGIYDGFLGPGTGTFLALAFMLGLGFNLSRATAATKALNCASNVASLLLFLLAKKVWFAAGLTMGAGQWLGARAGSRMVVARGTQFIRPIFLTMVILIILKMIYDIYLKPRG